MVSRQLPPDATIELVKNQAQALIRERDIDSLSEARSQIAAQYGFESWARLEQQLLLCQHIRQDRHDLVLDTLLAIHAESRRAVGLADETDCTPLQLASLYNQNAANLMLTRTVSPDLHSACALGLTDQIKALVSSSGMAAVFESLPPLGFALLRGQLDGVNALLAAGDDPNRPMTRAGFYVWEIEAAEQGSKSWSPLHVASLHGYLPGASRIIRALVDSGADLEARCTLGETPLHLAACHGWVASIEILLSLGSQVDAPTDDGDAIAHTLADPELSEVCPGQTPLMVAVREGMTDAVRCLLRNGADVTKRDAQGKTPLHVSANPWWQENTDIVTLLLDAGATKDVADQYNRLPADIARTHNNAETLAILSR